MTANNCAINFFMIDNPIVNVGIGRVLQLKRGIIRNKAGPQGFSGILGIMAQLIVLKALDCVRAAPIANRAAEYGLRNVPKPSLFRQRIHSPIYI